MEDSKIEWTDSTFNPWIGCSKVSPGCMNCYAEALATRRMGAQWGPGAPRRRTGEGNWKLPLRWNRKAEREGVRHRVFCASMADVFDPEVPVTWRQELFRLVEATPRLDWLILTKRPQLAKPFLEGLFYDHAWPHVWLGTSVENRRHAGIRIPQLLALPAAGHFLSCEPLLEDIAGEVEPWLAEALLHDAPFFSASREATEEWAIPPSRAINWVIVGGESGAGARAMHPDWVHSLRDVCEDNEVPFFFKQWGEWVTEEQAPEDIVLPGQGHCPFEDHNRNESTVVFKVGKKRAGALLDGCTYRGVPAVLRPEPVA